MAWRIDESVIRGEIDNRTRGRVTGRIWFVGRAEPVELDLAGNAWRDLAGRRLEFENPNPQPGDLEQLAECQAGVIGDCTASRKVKVPDVTKEEFGRLYRERKPFPWHWGNSLYFEWFSTRNGRVVIESADYRLTVMPEIAWEMSEAEEEAQRRANGEAMGSFFKRAAEALNEAQAGDATQTPLSTPKENDEDLPLSEADAEKMQDDSDRLADRIQARLDREGDDADYEKILQEELERRARERGEDPLTPEQEAERAAWIDEMNRIAEEALENPDPEVEAELEKKHPLAERVHELSIRLMSEPEDRGWITSDMNAEHPLIDLSTRTMSAGAKLAGALNGQTWPPSVVFCANNLVRLKRARSYVDDALLAADVCREQNLGEPAWLEEVQCELNAAAHECDLLIGELRAKLERGFD